MLRRSRSTCALWRRPCSRSRPAAGCGEEEPQGDPPRKPGEIELQPFKGNLEFGEDAKLSGRLIRNGQPLAGEQVRLETDEFPFDDYEAGEMATTDKAGKFSFRVKPELNTQYRALAEDLPDTTSPERLVPVIATIRSDEEKLNGGRQRETLTFRHSPRISLEGLPAYHYVEDLAVAQETGKLPFRETTEIRERAPGMSVMTYVLARGTRWHACIPFPVSRGIGRVASKEPQCIEDSRKRVYYLRARGRGKG